MLKQTAWGVALMWTLNCLPALAGDAVVPPEEVRGSLVIIGGSLRYSEPEVWSAIVSLAGGPGAKIAVFPTASGEPMKYGPPVVETLNRFGAQAFLVPLGVKNIDQDYTQVVNDPAQISPVREADGVFFIGGTQSRITRTLYTEDGENTPMLDAVWEVYHRGGCIAGTSAGAAIMSQVMFRDPPSVLRTMQKRPLEMGKELDRGLGFMDADWFVDQHLLVRGRFARTLAAMQAAGTKYGVGVDENTAMIIRNGTELTVAGYKGAVMLDLSAASQDPEISSFNMKNARLTYLDRGDTLNLKTLAVTPAPSKRDEPRIDPSAEDFKPFYHDPLFFSDILGNTTVADVMAKLIESKHDEAIGLAFDGNAARREPTQGFEFRFYRQRDSVGWYSHSNGTDEYTVSNIHLDIRPVEVMGPLYK
ncbi:MAG: cyanophycinase [Pirellulales bacterium]